MDYAQARMQARFGDRPDESAWRDLAGATQFAALLQRARRAGLTRWVAGLDSAGDSHTVELAMRARWRECVAELASWMPSRWQAAMLWTAVLPDLPVLVHLARGEPPLEWMRHDPSLQPYAIEDRDARIARLKGDALSFIDSQWDSVIASGKAGPQDDSPLRVAWRDEWKRRWPRWPDREGFDALAHWLDVHLSHPLTDRREEALRRLRKLFRDLTLHPAVAFVYLAFIAFDLARLRAALLRLMLVEPPDTATRTGK